MRVHEGQDHSRQDENTRLIATPSVLGMAINEAEMHQPAPSSMAQLRRKGYKSLREMARSISKLLGRYVSDIRRGFGVGSHRRERPLRKRELPVGYGKGSTTQQTKEQESANALGLYNGSRSIRKIGDRCDNYFIQNCEQVPTREVVYKTGLYEQVYDLLNCGPNSRFTVMGEDGPMLVHNCTQAIARDILAHKMQALDDLGYDIIMHVHDELVIEGEPGSLGDVNNVMAEALPWAKGLPLGSAGFESEYYKKD
jgi:hypothetical protein